VRGVLRTRLIRDYPDARPGLPRRWGRGLHAAAGPVSFRTVAAATRRRVRLCGGTRTRSENVRNSTEEVLPKINTLATASLSVDPWRTPRAETPPAWPRAFDGAALRGVARQAHQRTEPTKGGASMGSRPGCGAPNLHPRVCPVNSRPLPPLGRPPGRCAGPLDSPCKSRPRTTGPNGVRAHHFGSSFAVFASTHHNTHYQTLRRWTGVRGPG
jgi:hypothetical protein